MCPEQVHEGSSDLLYVPLSVVMIDWGNLRGQIFSRTDFAPTAPSCFSPQTSPPRADDASVRARRAVVVGEVLYLVKMYHQPQKLISRNRCNQ